MNVRPLVPLSLALAALASGQKPTVKPNPATAKITAEYAKLNAAYKQHAVKPARAWYDANTDASFTYTSKDKIKFDRVKFLAGIDDMFKKVRSVSESTMKVMSFKEDGGKVIAVVAGRFEGIVEFDGAPLLMTDVSESVDTWVKVGTGWRLESTRVTKEDVQMRQRK